MKTVQVTIKHTIKPLVITLVKTIRKDKVIKINAIGATATNKTTKAIEIAKGFLKEDHLDLDVQFEQIELSTHDVESIVLQFTIKVKSIKKETPTQGFTPLEY